MEVAQIDIDEWEALVGNPVVTEATLLCFINNCLHEDGMLCEVQALRYVDSDDRNWEVAAFELHYRDMRDIDRRLVEIGQLIARATEGYRVAWPSTRLH
jgi:hypothetical protein